MAEQNAGAPPPRPVLSLGEALIDFIVADGAASLEEAATFAARPGGAPANVTVALARLGVSSAFGGVVGDDPFGRRLRSTLAADGVDVSRLRAATDAETTLAFAWKDARGDAHFRLLRGNDARLTAEDVEQAGIEGMAALVVGSVALAAQPSGSAVTRAAASAAHHGVPICFDVNLRPTLWPDLARARAACQPVLARATLVKLSLDDARGLFDAGDEPVAAFERVRRALPPAGGAHERQLVLTDGARGCWYATTTGDAPPAHVPAYDVDAVEPTGAGDAFTAALISRLIGNGWGTLGVGDVRYAAAAGALATTRPGALDGLPTLTELEAFLSAR